MTEKSPTYIGPAELRLRPLVSLAIFLSAYAPLALILVVKDYDPAAFNWLPRHPYIAGTVLFAAVSSCVITILAVNDAGNGFPVQISKASNKSGEMFGYTIPYMLGFLKIDFGDWQVLFGLAVFMAMMFVVAYRSQTVLVNPILALIGYRLLDCTFKRNEVETQALVITRSALRSGQTCDLKCLSPYLFLATMSDTDDLPAEGRS